MIPRTTRLVALDGLRGAASLSVAMFHETLLVPGAGAWRDSLLPGLLWNGHEAVLIFFVLSGLVLSLPFWCGSNDGYRRFAIRRVFRIYPAYFVAIFFAVALVVVSHLFDGTWVPKATPLSVLSDLLMLDRREDMELDDPIWSLVQEMRISLVFPLLIWSMRRLGPAAVPVYLAASVASGILGHGTADPAAASALTTVSSAWLFVFGAEIGRNLPSLRERGQQFGRAMQIGLLLLCCAAVSFSPDAGAIGQRYGILVMFAAGLMVIAVAVLPVSERLFVAPAMQFFGRISYSLYLVHRPIICAAVGMFGSRVPAAVIVMLTMTLSIVCAVAMQRWIERPGIALGRRLLLRPAGAA